MNRKERRLLAKEQRRDRKKIKQEINKSPIKEIIEDCEIIKSFSRTENYHEFIGLVLDMMWTMPTQTERDNFRNYIGPLLDFDFTFHKIKMMRDGVFKMTIGCEVAVGRCEHMWFIPEPHEMIYKPKMDESALDCLDGMKEEDITDEFLKSKGLAKISFDDIKNSKKL